MTTLRIVVIGATGMVGRRVVAEAAARGHRVVAAARRPMTQPARAPISTAYIDLARPATVPPVLAGADAVVLAVRPAAGAEHTVAATTGTVLSTASELRVPVLVVGGAGPLSSPTTPGALVVDDPAYVPDAARETARASAAQLRACQQHPRARWTYLSPPAVLAPGRRTGSYRRGTTTLLVNEAGESRISVEDLAVAAIDEIEDPHPHLHFTVAWP